MDGGVDDAGAMLDLDDGKLSPRDISPICTIRRLTEENIISKNTSLRVMATDLSSRSGLVCVWHRMSEGLAVKTLERTGTNALPYIYAPSFRVPDATL
jgi:hypothetical protein